MPLDWPLLAGPGSCAGRLDRHHLRLELCPVHGDRVVGLEGPPPERCCQRANHDLAMLRMLDQLRLVAVRAAAAHDRRRRLDARCPRP